MDVADAIFFKVLFWAMIYVTTGRNSSQTTISKDVSQLVTSESNRKPNCLDESDKVYKGKGSNCKVGKNDSDCVLPVPRVHDDTTFCNDGSDVCFDHNHHLLPHNCFQCLNGYQVILLNQVCNGVFDCNDFSDECLCQNIKNPVCFQITYATAENFQTSKKSVISRCKLGDIKCLVNSTQDTTEAITCVSYNKTCDGIKDCIHGDDEKFCAKTITCDNKENNAIACDGKVTCSDFSDECNADCWNKPDYCEHVFEKKYHCYGPSHNMSFHRITEARRNLSHSQVCNNFIDCLNSNDELFCSTATHFYCLSGNVRFVNQSARYDDVMDCKDGSDECPYLFHVEENCAFKLRNEMIQNPFLQISVWVVAMVSLLGNSLVMVYTGRELWVDRKEQKLGRLAKCNRNFVLNLAIADFLKGFSLLVIGVEGSIMSNKYCSSDREWRSSSFCVTIGMMVQCSSQTSVFLLLLMTSYRLYGTLHPFRVEESRLMGGAAAATFAAWLISIIIAVIPQSHFAADYFTHQYWFPLPFFNHDLLNRTEVEGLVLKIYTLSRNTEKMSLIDLHWSTMINYLLKSNLTTMSLSWNNQNVIPIGFYNQVPMCQPFFYPSFGDTAWLYMTAIVLFNFLAFVYIGIAYLLIYKNSSRPCVRKSIRKRSKQWRKDNRKMQKKIFCLVFTDMACWFPISIILVLKLCGVPIHPIVHAITGTILLPLSSAVNPLVYSNVSRNLLRRLCRKKSPFDRESPSLERTSIKDSIGSLLNIKTLVNNSPRMYKSNNNKNSEFLMSKNITSQSNPKRRRVKFRPGSFLRESFSDNENRDNLLNDGSTKAAENGCKINNKSIEKTLNFDLEESDL